MNHPTNSLFALTLCLGTIALGGCNTPQQKPYSPPQTQRQTQSPPPPETQPQQERQQPAPAAAGGQQPMTESQSQPQPQSPSQSQPPSQSQAAPSDAGSPPPPAQAEGEPAPSSESADVEITDIPVDEDGNPIVDETPPGGGQQQQSAANAPPPGQQAGGGGGATPKSGQREDPGGTSGGGAPPPSYGQNEDQGRGTSGGVPRVDGAEAGPVIDIGAKTEDERLAALDQDLDAKLARFDELMRRAREEAEQDRAAMSTAGSGSGADGVAGGGRGGGFEDGRGARENAPPQGRGAGGQADTSTGLGHTPDMTGSTSGGDYKYASSGPIPTDIPDARDDDIVARQLREAATRETDPVLREKLWDEYRKYKKGIGR